MKFKVDENLPGDIAELLRAAGHDASTVREQGHVGAPDGFLAKVCLEEGRALVTLDIGFGNVREYPPEQFAGIIVLRPDEPSKASVMKLAAVLLAQMETASVDGALWVITEDRVRVRRGKADTP